MEVSLPQGGGRGGLHDAHIAALTANHVNLRTVERTFTIGEHHLDAFGEAKHRNSMSSLILRKLKRSSNVGSVKQVHFVKIEN